MLAQELPKVVVSPLAFLLVGVLFGSISAAAGVFVARNRGVSPVLGGVFAFVLPFIGLFVIMLLGGRDQVSTGGFRRESLLHDPAEDEVPISSDVAEALGLPKQVGAEEPNGGGPVEQVGVVAEPVAAPVETVAEPVAEGWWAVDPTGRFAQRWWDGTAWTVHVLSADGTAATDAGE